NVMHGRDWIFSASVGVALITAATAATTINVSDAVVQTGVKRFGLNLGALNYFDSGQIMKQLVFRNPGFEPQIYQSIIHVASGTANGCIDDITSTSGSQTLHEWPSRFWQCT